MNQKRIFFNVSKDIRPSSSVPRCYSRKKDSNRLKWQSLPNAESGISKSGANGKVVLLNDKSTWLKKRISDNSILECSIIPSDRKSEAHHKIALKKLVASKNLPKARILKPIDIKGKAEFKVVRQPGKPNTFVIQSGQDKGNLLKSVDHYQWNTSKPEISGVIVGQTPTGDGKIHLKYSPHKNVNRVGTVSDIHSDISDIVLTEEQEENGNIHLKYCTPEERTICLQIPSEDGVKQGQKIKLVNKKISKDMENESTTKVKETDIVPLDGSALGKECKKDDSVPIKVKQDEFKFVDIQDIISGVSVKQEPIEESDKTNENMIEIFNMPNVEESLEKPKENISQKMIDASTQTNSVGFPEMVDFVRKNVLDFTFNALGTDFILDECALYFQPKAATNRRLRNAVSIKQKSLFCANLLLLHSLTLSTDLADDKCTSSVQELTGFHQNVNSLDEQTKKATEPKPGKVMSKRVMKNSVYKNKLKANIVAIKNLQKTKIKMSREEIKIKLRKNLQRMKMAKTEEEFKAATIAAVERSSDITSNNEKIKVANTETVEGRKSEVIPENVEMEVTDSLIISDDDEKETAEVKNATHPYNTRKRILKLPAGVVTKKKGAAAKKSLVRTYGNLRLNSKNKLSLGNKETDLYKNLVVNKTNMLKESPTKKNIEMKRIFVKSFASIKEKEQVDNENDNSVLGPLDVSKDTINCNPDDRKKKEDFSSDTKGKEKNPKRQTQIKNGKDGEYSEMIGELEKFLELQIVEEDPIPCEELYRCEHCTKLFAVYSKYLEHTQKCPEKSDSQAVPPQKIYVKTDLAEKIDKPEASQDKKVIIRRVNSNNLKLLKNAKIVGKKLEFCRSELTVPHKEIFISHNKVVIFPDKAAFSLARIQDANEGGKILVGSKLAKVQTVKNKPKVENIVNNLRCCAKCKKVLLVEEMERHRETCMHHYPSMKCEICDIWLSSTDGIMERHLARHDDAGFFCKKCGVIFPGSALKVHKCMLPANTLLPFEDLCLFDKSLKRYCKLCLKSFENIKMFGSHVYSEHRWQLKKIK
ncbi:hypothetical protein HHI36_021334 [Cryptolaemus montrouzieri]|uniref:C2H2-type domain-containing protein n=1 Tax=Cryptolaemus montrouzieri TaxID=559131 RepID=A0ABD2MWY0_9CUCU